jgi:hypothetical protein
MRDAHEEKSVAVKGDIPSWWTVMHLTGSIGSILLASGVPFVHALRGMTPMSVGVGGGKTGVKTVGFVQKRD